MKVDYVVLANKKNYARFCRKYKDKMVARERTITMYFGEWVGREYKIKGKTVVLILDYEIE